MSARILVLLSLLAGSIVGSVIGLLLFLSFFDRPVNLSPPPIVKSVVSLVAEPKDPPPPQCHDQAYKTESWNKFDCPYDAVIHREGDLVLCQCREPKLIPKQESKPDGEKDGGETSGEKDGG